MAASDDFATRIRQRLARIYPKRDSECLPRILELAEQYSDRIDVPSDPSWDEADSVLITYGDQVKKPDSPALPALTEFVASTGISELINTVHLLPFCPYSSDDGFSVIDYRQVDPEIGDWEHVQQMRKQVALMFDLVLNHCSSQSEWFQAYLRGESPHDRYFVEADPSVDLSDVVRPRSLPLLTAYKTSRGTRHVWTTFSADQVDLNFAEPDVLIEMLDVLLFYVEQGARIIRLDAVAFLWKEVGTTCLHLPQTHEVIKLMHDLLEEVAPHVILLTETNVPHVENVSYFGDGDEAHMVYQFSLPPLLLDALLCGDATAITDWLHRLDDTPPGTTFFNFTASHDGVGVRPLEGLVPDHRLDALVEAVKERGGLVSMRRRGDGTDSPYELNIAYFDALSEPAGMDTELHVRRFLTSQAIMLALRGIPGIYFHSLVGTPNYYEGVKESGHARRINRRRYQLEELMQTVNDDENPQARVFEGYKRLLAVRKQQPAFHPNGPQRVLPLEDSAILAFERTSPEVSQRIVVVANLSGDARDWRPPAEFHQAAMHDLLSDARFDQGAKIALEAYQIRWLEVRE